MHAAREEWDDDAILLYTHTRNIYMHTMVLIITHKLLYMSRKSRSETYDYLRKNVARRNKQKLCEKVVATTYSHT